MLRAKLILKMEKIWDPNHSKWKAALEKGAPIGLKGSENILYLGASSGTTVSFLSDQTSGKIFAVEKSPLMAIPLVKISEERKNIFPIFSDARDIEKISKKLENNKIDILFQDIPTIDQVRIIKEASKLVGKECKIYFSLKTQSISQEPKQKTLQYVKQQLDDLFNITMIEELEPFHQKHYFMILEKRS